MFEGHFILGRLAISIKKSSCSCLLFSFLVTHLQLTSVAGIQNPDSTHILTNAWPMILEVQGPFSTIGSGRESPGMYYIMMSVQVCIVSVFITVPEFSYGASTLMI